MDNELLEDVYAWMEEIEKRIWELGLQKHFELLPDKFIDCDLRGTILIYLSYLLRFPRLRMDLFSYKASRTVEKCSGCHIRMYCLGIVQTRLQYSAIL